MRFIRFISITLLALTGCTTLLDDRNVSYPGVGYTNVQLKPVMAIMSFDNRASFSGKWKLGDGMADILTTEMLKNRHVTVLERESIDDLMGEIVRQGKDLFRKEGRVPHGRLKNAQYLIRGAVTDFTVTGDASGWFSSNRFGLHGRAGRAKVSLNLTLVEIETGEIISSVLSSGAASSGRLRAVVNYKNLSFGGEAFFNTPLGKATEKAINKALKKILRELPPIYWQPRIAEAGPDVVIINGGRNTKVRKNDLFIVREEGRNITDPVTGNIIEKVPGRQIGKIRVVKVNPASSYAEILEGLPRRGHILEPAKQ